MPTVEARSFSLCFENVSVIHDDTVAGHAPQILNRKPFSGGTFRLYHTGFRLPESTPLAPRCVRSIVSRRPIPHRLRRAAGTNEVYTPPSMKGWHARFGRIILAGDCDATVVAPGLLPPFRFSDWK